MPKVTYVTDNLKNPLFTVRQAAKFTALVALLAILCDATLGHGLTWENDPYWTYWVTKTFLIATVFGLGTLWFGIGAKKGAVITAIHTLILTVYYWSLSPIGLPSSPEWLDLQHTWVTGVPIHFGVIYLGYLVALWIWRRQPIAKAEQVLEPRVFGLEVLLMSIAIVLVAGGVSNIALGHFAGITWFVVRLLITVPFLIIWRTIVGRDRLSSIVGGIVLALIWAAYSQFLGPMGLPDMHNLRVLSQAAPPSPVHWLNYNQLWLISFPIYLVAMVSLLLLGTYQTLKLNLAWSLILSVITITAVALIAGLTIPNEPSGNVARVNASGDVLVENGMYYSNQLEKGTGNISIYAKDEGGGRVSPLPPHDEINIVSVINSGGHIYQINADQPMVEDPMGQFTTWWGVGYDVNHHGRSGIGTNKLPSITSKLAAFAMGSITVDGKLIASDAPVHIMTAESGLAKGMHLEIDVGDSRMPPIPGLPYGHVRALWGKYNGTIPGTSVARYIGGDIVLLLAVCGALVINKSCFSRTR